MKLLKVIVQLKTATHKALIPISALIILSSQPASPINYKINANTDSTYLDKNDPLYITIKSRAVDDLKKSADPGTDENKSIELKIQSLSAEKQAQLTDVIDSILSDYSNRTFLDVGTFMLTFDVLGKMDVKELNTDYVIKVLSPGGNEYIAEFWEDGLAVNSEEHAIKWANELANSPLAKKNPGSDLGNVKEIKKTYAAVRKSIKDGKQERYTKVMALLYTLEKDGSVKFHHPFQAVIDFK